MTTPTPENFWCKYCGPDHPLRIEWRDEYATKQITDFSLSGTQMKFSAHKIKHPYAVCDNCKRESRGKE